MFTYVSYGFHIQTEKKEFSIKVLQKRSVKRGVKQKNMIKNKTRKITVQCKWL